MRRPKQSSLADLQRQCDEFNRMYSIGTTVRYYPVMGEREYRVRKTLNQAQVLSGHTAVIWLEGERGCVALDHCRVTFESANAVQPQPVETSEKSANTSETVCGHNFPRINSPYDPVQTCFLPSGHIGPHRSKEGMEGI